MIFFFPIYKKALNVASIDSFFSKTSAKESKHINFNIMQRLFVLVNFFKQKYFVGAKRSGSGCSKSG